MQIKNKSVSKAIPNEETRHEVKHEDLIRAKLTSAASKKK